LTEEERRKLVKDKTAQMKAIIQARKEKEAEDKLQAEKEQRRRSLAPNLYDDDDDSSSCVSMDMGSPPEKKPNTPPQDTGTINKAALPTGPKKAVQPTPSSKAPQINNVARAASPPTKSVLNLSIDTQKKRSYDAMSNSSSRRGSNADSPLFTEQSPITSPISTTLSASALAGMSRISKKVRTSVPDRSRDPTSQDLGRAPLPEWYLKAKMPSNTARDVMVAHRRVWDIFDNLKKSIKACETTTNSTERLTAVKQVSKLLHSLEFTHVKPYDLSKYKMLSEGQGLRRISDFHDTGFNFPWYLRADAQELYNKWLNEQWDPDMFRGIKNMVKSKETKGGLSIDAAHKLDWRFFGEGDFVAGQWWANQICAVRDGAHGSAQAGIAGIKTTPTAPGGATSIVLSEGHKEDIDEGEEIWYCGTEAKSGDSEPTASTKLMLESLISKLPVRVLRSSGLPAGNKYKPVRGFRYDGLYEVLSKKVIDRLKHHHLFRLKRLPGQIGLRYEGEAERPTDRELEEYEKEMKKYGRRKSLD
jgi:hypothetical protein